MIEVFQGDSFSVSTPVYNSDGSPKDLSGASATVRVATSGSLKAMLAKTPTVVDNEFVVSFVEADTINLAPGRYDYQLRTEQGVVLVETINIKPLIKESS